MPKVICSYCSKEFFRDQKRINKSKTRGWKAFCPSSCRDKAANFQVVCRCSRKGCNKTFGRIRNQYLRSQDHYCSRRCAAIVNNSKYPKIKAVIKKCVYCGRDFKSREKYCSRICKDKSMIITKEKILNFIKDFVDKNERIPFKKEYRHYNAARLRFGTWNIAVKKAGFEPNPVLFAKKHYAKDGHKCDSLSEKIIDDWFYKRKIKHLRNVKYPGDTGFSVDFKVGDSWIEFFGLEGELKEYDRLKRRKLDLIKKEKLNLIDLHPRDLFPKVKLNERLQFLPE